MKSAFSCGIAAAAARVATTTQSRTKARFSIVKVASLLSSQSMTSRAPEYEEESHGYAVSFEVAGIYHPRIVDDRG